MNQSCKIIVWTDTKNEFVYNCNNMYLMTCLQKNYTHFEQLYGLRI